MKKIIFTAFLLGAAWMLTAEETVTYRLRQGTTVETFSIAVRRTGDGYEITETQAEGKEERISRVDAAYRTGSFSFRSRAAKTDYTAVRDGNTITVSGRLRDRPLKREFKINDRPWYQAIESALAVLAARAGRSAGPEHFWFINADEAELMEMTAESIGWETVTLGGASYGAMKVKVGLTGIASLFWSAGYWFRAGDHRYLRYETTGGPAIVIELDTRPPENTAEKKEKP